MDPIKDIRVSLPQIKENYVMLAVYIIYGFDVNAISIFTHKDAKSIYNLKTALANKLLVLPKGRLPVYNRIIGRMNSR